MINGVHIEFDHPQVAGLTKIIPLIPTIKSADHYRYTQWEFSSPNYYRNTMFNHT